MRHIASALRALLTGGTFWACMLWGANAMAQNYPGKPVKIVVPYPPGGVLDALVRSMAPRLQARLGQPFIVENVPGASGNIGLAACGRASNDGLTLCVTTNDAISVNPFLFRKLAFDPRELVPVQRLVNVDGVIFASAASGFLTLADAIAAARPAGSVTWGSFGIGSTSHLYMGWLNKDKGLDFLHVPYKGSAPLLQAALAGEVQVGLLASGILGPHFKSGRLKPLAVLGAKRLDVLPSVPSVQESGVDFYVQTWFGMFAPPGTPSAIVEQLNAETAAILDDARFRAEVLAPQGFRAAALPAHEFAQYLKQDRLAAQRLVSTTGLTIE